MPRFCLIDSLLSIDFESIEKLACRPARYNFLVLITGQWLMIQRFSQDHYRVVYYHLHTFYLII